MDLQEVLEEYIVGNFSQALNDAVSLPGSDVNASVLVFRSHIGLGQYDLVQTEVPFVRSFFLYGLSFF